MITNHHIYDFSVFDKDFLPMNLLGHRDKQVIRQYMQNFSVAINIIRRIGTLPRVLETGAGLSTIVFSKLLNLPGEKISTIDAFSHQAISINAREINANFELEKFVNLEIIDGITIDLNELESFYNSTDSTLLGLKRKEVVHNLELYLNLEMEDRKYQQISRIIDANISPAAIKEYLITNSLFSNGIIRSYQNNNDEFVFLKKTSVKPILRDLLIDYSPNIIYLDSGEFSTVIEFNIIDDLAEIGTILIIQDIFFPKSIKSFLIASAINFSSRWKILWVDRTTPQGIMICQKKY